MFITTDASIFEIEPKKVVVTGTSFRKQILDVFTAQSQHLPKLFIDSIEVDLC